MISVLADPALGSSHTISAMIQPARIACTIIGANGACTASSAIDSSARQTGGAKKFSCAIASANNQVPARLATNTTAQNRNNCPNRATLKFDSTGSTGVSVVSVNSCCRPRITIRNPSV